MKHIIFVDDERKILDGLRRMLRPMRHEWNMLFLNSGREALSALQNEPCDLILSDVRMPDMNGIELLTQVKELYPHIVRIALSGTVDKQLMLRSVEVFHQFLTKPCSLETLKATIARSCSIRNLLSDQKLVQLISKMTSLPSLPSLYVKIVEEFASANTSLKRVAKLISQDIAMTAKLLQLVNSAFFGIPRKIVTAEDAVLMLGFDVVRSLVLNIKLFSSFRNNRQVGLDIEMLWENSAKSSVLAKQIAQSEKLNSKECDFAQMAGMLQDVGILILADNFPDAYKEIQEVVYRDAVEIWQAETQLLGQSHMEVGAYLLCLWGLPDTIVETVAYHHRPSRSLADSSFSPLAALHAANSIIHDSAEQFILASPIDCEYLSKVKVLEKLPSWHGMYQKSGLCNQEIR